MTYETDYSTIAAIIGEASEKLVDVQDWFTPDDDEKLAELIIRINALFDRAEALALSKVKVTQ